MRDVHREWEDSVVRDRLREQHDLVTAARHRPLLREDGRGYDRRVRADDRPAGAVLVERRLETICGDGVWARADEWQRDPEPLGDDGIPRGDALLQGYPVSRECATVAPTRD